MIYYKTFHYKMDISSSFKNKIVTPPLIITRIGIGDTNPTHSPKNRPLCIREYDTCKENLTINHTETKCPKYTEARRIFILTQPQHALNEKNTDRHNVFIFQLYKLKSRIVNYILIFFFIYITCTSNLKLV